MLQLFDRTFDTSHMQPDERASVNQQIKVRAAEVVETLKAGPRASCCILRSPVEVAVASKTLESPLIGVNLSAS